MTAISHPHPLQNQNHLILFISVLAVQSDLENNVHMPEASLRSIIVGVYRKRIQDQLKLTSMEAMIMVSLLMMITGSGITVASARASASSNIACSMVIGGGWRMIGRRWRIELSLRPNFNLFYLVKCFILVMIYNSCVVPVYSYGFSVFVLSCFLCNCLLFILF